MDIVHPLKLNILLELEIAKEFFTSLTCRFPKLIIALLKLSILITLPWFPSTTSSYTWKSESVTKFRHDEIFPIFLIQVILIMFINRFLSVDCTSKIVLSVLQFYVVIFPMISSENSVTTINGREIVNAVLI
jgi:hypothetical protein